VFRLVIRLRQRNKSPAFSFLSLGKIRYNVVNMAEIFYLGAIDLSLVSRTSCHGFFVGGWLIRMADMFVSE
jgi:hypothetical protein